MAKLLEITGKAISGEWGQDDDTGTGIPVLRTTNFTNEGFVNYKNVVTRSISKKNIAEKYLRHGDVIIEKSGGSDKQPVGRVIFFEGEENKYLFNNFTGLLRVQNPEEWLPKYVFYALYAYYRNGGTRAVVEEFFSISPDSAVISSVLCCSSASPPVVASLSVLLFADCADDAAFSIILAFDSAALLASSALSYGSIIPAIKPTSRTANTIKFFLKLRFSCLATILKKPHRTFIA